MWFSRLWHVILPVSALLNIPIFQYECWFVDVVVIRLVEKGSSLRPAIVLREAIDDDVYVKVLSILLYFSFQFLSHYLHFEIDSSKVSH